MKISAVPKVTASIKKRMWAVAATLLLCAAAFIFTLNDDFLYDVPVARIVSVSESGRRTVYNGDYSEEAWDQLITAVITNGAEKGQEVSLTNPVTGSGVYDTAYRIGEKVFLQTGDGGYSISGLKRDAVTVFLTGLFLTGIVAVSGRRGIRTVLSLVFNAGILLLGLRLYLDRSVSILLIAALATVIFSTVCLLIIGGFRRATWAAVVSTLLGTAVTFGLAMAVLTATDFGGLYVEMLEFSAIEIDYRVMFMAELLMGDLGAIMDISITMSAGYGELLQRDPDISREALLSSGREIGRDVMSTMVNVLMTAYLCGCLPMVLLLAHNDISLSTYFTFYGTLTVVRFLVGGIGITLTIPIARYVCVWIMRRARV